jgi:hypothetical protein
MTGQSPGLMILPGWTGRRQEMSDKARASRKSGFDMEIWWGRLSLPMKIVMGVCFGILGIGLVALFGWVVMLLWNWLMPDLFGLKRLDFWKAWGLLALSWILFKNFGSGSNNRRNDRKRRRQLRSVMEEEPAAEGAPAGSDRGMK